MNCPLAAIAVVVCTLVPCAPAYAADCISASPIRAGEIATCAGILTPAPWAARCLTCLRVELPVCRAEAVRIDAVCRADLDACRAGRRAVEQLAEERLRLLREAVDRIEPAPAPWWRSAWITVPVSLVVGGLAGYGLPAMAAR